MIRKLIKNIKKHELLNEGDTVVAAVSGGPDSVALLKSLADISAGYKLKLIAAHFNHALRGEESEQDERFVSELAGRFGMIFETQRAGVKTGGNIGKASLENTARIERYDFLTEVAGKYDASRIALGHNLHDQSETIIMNLLRGSGVEGLRGILPVREGIFIRPLLDITRAEIMDFLNAHNLKFRKDSSNLSTAFQRNRLRHQLIPELREKYNPRLDEQLGRLGEIVRLEDEFISIQVRETLKRWGIAPGGKGCEIGISDLLGVHEALQRRIVKSVLESMSPQRNGIEYNHVLSVINLCRYATPHGRLSLPFGIKIRRDYQKLYICNDEGSSKAGLFSYLLQVPGETDIPEAGIRMRTRLIDAGFVDFSRTKAAYLDYDKLAHPLEVRNFRHGDRMQPLGLKGSQKIKKVFIDRKIDTEKRMIIPMVADMMSVLWIPGIRFSERAKVSGATKQVLEIEIV